jgi:uncharacterized protein (TIGR02145 family)
MKKGIVILSIVLMTVMMLTSCRDAVKSGTITDKKSSNIVSNFNEKASSNEVAIGKQVWMTENLNVDKFRNGGVIPEAKTAGEWKKKLAYGQPAWCYYYNDPLNGAKYGKLYNWYAVNDPSGLAPKGWKIPSDKDWTILTNYLGGEDIAGLKMKTTSGWENEKFIMTEKKLNGNGNNYSGFSALPGGERQWGGEFEYLNFYGYWWSSTNEADGSNNAWYICLSNYNGNVFRAISGGESMLGGLSVRCIKD